MGGPTWYRFLGAGERMARAAERGDWRPRDDGRDRGDVDDLGGLRLSGAGLIGRLPLLKLALVVITAIYLLRGLVSKPSLLGRPDLSPAF